MSTHTPGPWQVLAGTIVTVKDKDGNIIFNVGYTPEAPGSNKFWTVRDNARLIAASPTMYEYVLKKANEGDIEAKKIIKMLD
jgi:hypothetical protein